MNTQQAYHTLIFGVYNMDCWQDVSIDRFEIVKYLAWVLGFLHLSDEKRDILKFH